MKEKRTTYTQDATKPRRLSKAAKERLDAKTDADIDYSDIPEVTDFSKAVRGGLYRPVKQQITLRLDKDVVAWFRSHYDQYQPAINEALRQYVETHD